MICNATPLICFAKLNQLELLKKLFKKIIITKAVRDEVLIKGKEGYAFFEKAIQEKWIEIINPKNVIDFGLDKGENTSINLAREIKSTLIIDDAEAVKVAKSLNIDFIRTTTLIIMALRKYIINKKQAKSLIQSLVGVGYYISPSIYSKLIDKIGSYYHYK